MTKQATCKRWNVPDWHSVDGYAYITLLSHDTQRWEFLRRTWFYRQACDTGDYASDLDFGLETMYRPQTRGDELPANFKFLDSSSLGRALTMDTVCEDGSPPDGDLALEAHIGDRVLSLLRRKYCLIVFDPNVGHIEQIKQAQKTLKGLQSQRLNQPTDQEKEVSMLRVMDAYNEAQLTDEISGAYGLKQNIANAIWPHKIVTSKEADYAFKQALSRANRMNLR